MITVRDIAYVRSGVEDLAGAVRFASEVVGLEVVEGGGPGVTHLRADARHHCLTFVEGGSGVLATGFTVADADALADAETELEKHGLTVERGDAAGALSRKVGHYIGFDDPYGNHVELAADQFCTAEQVRFARLAGITEFGHVCLDVPDIHEAYQFYSTVFSARVSDWIGDAACLTRIDAVHHKLALFRGDEPALCHVNFQVGDYDDLFRNWRFLQEANVEIIMGPGRHPTSGSAFIYFRGPENLTYEYATGTRLIHDGDGWSPRNFDPTLPSSIDMWRGPIAPTTKHRQLPNPAHATV